VADDPLVDNGAEADYIVSADDAAGAYVQRFKLAYSADGSAVHVPADADGLLVNLGANNDVVVSGTVAATDGGGSLTVDAASLPLPTGASTETTLAGVETDTGAILTELQAGLDVTIIGGSVTADTELTTADLDTGAGTDTRAVVGLALAASGGALLVGPANPLPVSDNGGSLTVDGTVAVSGSVAVTGPLTDAQLRATAVPVSGTVTIQDGGNTITVDGAVSVSALPGSLAGKAEDAAAASADVGLPVLAVRRDSASSGVDTDGDYAMLSVDSTGALRVAGGGGGVQYAEDAAHVSGDTGTMALAVRRDAASAGGADGDYVALSTDSNGALRVTGAGGGTQYNVDVAAGAADTGTLALAVRDDALAALTPVDGDYTQLRTNANGALWVIPSGTVTVDGSGVTQPVSGTVTIQDGGNTITVDGTVAVSGTVTVDSELPAAAALSDNFANPTAPGVGAFAMTWDGSTWDRVRSSVGDAAAATGLIQNLGMLWNGATHDRMPGNATDGQLVNLGANNDVTVTGTVTANLAAGTNNIGDVDVLSLPALPAGTNNIGDVDVLTLPALPAGNNNIGDVDVASLPALPAGTNNIGDVDVLTLPALAAGTNTIGLVRKKDASGTVDDAGSDRTVQYAIIDAATSGDNTLKAAVASRKIRVLSAFLVAAGTVNARFESGAGGTALTGQMNLIANTGFVLPYNPHGWMETAVNTLLNLELSAAVSVDGCFTYCEIA
jgi:hypothetical protein